MISYDQCGLVIVGLLCVIAVLLPIVFMLVWYVHALRGQILLAKSVRKGFSLNNKLQQLNSLNANKKFHADSINSNASSVESFYNIDLESGNEAIIAVECIYE